MANDPTEVIEQYANGIRNSIATLEQKLDKERMRLRAANDILKQINGEVILEKVGAERSGGRPRMVLEVLKSRGRETHLNDIAAELGLEDKKDSLRATLNRCAKEGRFFYIALPSLYGLLEWKNGVNTKNDEDPIF